MKHRMKRALALLLCLVLLGTLAPAFTAQAEEIRIIPAEESEGDIVLVGENAAAKPVVTTQPKSVTAAVDTTAKFTVKATGAETYQWYWRKSASGTWSKSTLSGSTTATLSVKATAARDGYQYRCKLSNDYGSVYTEPAALTVQTKPVITAQPASVGAAQDSTVKFSVKATGAEAYQWYWRKSASGTWSKSTLSGCTTATLSVKATAARDGYQYRCRVSNAAGYVYSGAAALTVQSLVPVITAQPAAAAAVINTTAQFTVAAEGAAAYQWYYRSGASGSWAKTTLSGCTTATLSVKATAARDGYQYRCKVSNDYGSVYTEPAALTVIGSLPVITAQPADAAAAVDTAVQFTVTAEDADSYQWYYRANESAGWAKTTLSGCTTAILTVKVTAARDGYQYRCKVSNEYGYTYSEPAALTVNADGTVTYRALLIGQTYEGCDPEAVPPLTCAVDVENLTNALGSVRGALGGDIRVTGLIDASAADIRSGIAAAFADADEDDVSIFYYSGHGLADEPDLWAGAMITVEAGGGYACFRLDTLAELLRAVPGRVVVLMDSCGSGAAIYENGKLTAAGSDARRFSEAVIRAFAGPVENLGDFREPKFIVMTGAAHLEYSWESSGGGWFTWYFARGIRDGKPADADGDGTVTLCELYDYVYTNVYNRGPFQDASGELYQHVQVYPENSSYPLFR